MAIFPLENTAATITSYFGTRVAPIAGSSTEHKGIDISTPSGTNVLASISGTVTAAGYNDTSGYYVFVNNGEYTTVYRHLSKILVEKGQNVSQGSVIAKSGNTGVSTGSHLHFEVLKNGVAINPLDFVGNQQCEGQKSAEFKEKNNGVVYLLAAAIIAIFLLN